MKPPYSRVLWNPSCLPSCKLWLDPSVGFINNTSWTDRIQGIAFTYNVGGGSTAVKSYAINGSPSVTCTLGGYFSTATTIASIISAAAWTTSQAFQYTGAVVDTSAYLLPGTVMDSGSFWQGGSVSTTKFHAGQYNGGPYVSDTQAITTGTNYFTTARYNGTNIQTSKNGAALDAGLACGNVAALTGTIEVASSYNHLVTLAGSLGHIVVCNTALGAADLAQLNNWMAAHSGV